MPQSEPVSTAAVITHGRVETIVDGLERLHAVAEHNDVTRVTVLERVNARELKELPFAPELVVCDVSFISLKLVLPPALALAAPGWQALVLVKPQFEAGKEEVGKGGVIRDPEIRRRVVREIAEASLDWHARVAGVVDSGLPGPKGNREIFIQLVNDAEPSLPSQLEEWISDAAK